MGSKLDSESDVNVYPGIGYRCYYDLPLSRRSAQMLLQIIRWVSYALYTMVISALTVAY